VPACNFAQTPALAAVRIAAEAAVPHARIARVRIRVPQAGARYPGCDCTGPFAHILQGKMSIQYTVAVALVTGAICEDSYALLDDPRVKRLLEITTLEVDERLTAAYPGRQGAEVEVSTASGESRAVRLDDVIHATEDEVRERFRKATAAALGNTRAGRIDAFIEGIAEASDAGELGRLLRDPAPA
jgi:2-methylcitrate dehydratase PrpD